jgi:hypothetical protein
MWWKFLLLHKISLYWCIYQGLIQGDCNVFFNGLFKLHGLFNPLLSISFYLCDRFFFIFAKIKCIFIRYCRYVGKLEHFLHLI